MNIQQFAALKAGDKIENPTNGSRGEVTRTTDDGVSVQWGGGGPDFFFPVHGRAWVHWELATPETCAICQEAIGHPHKDGCPAGTGAPR